MPRLRNAVIVLPICLLLALVGCKSAEPESAQAAPAPPPHSAGGNYGAEAIKTAMREHIERRTELGDTGVFEITDPRTSQVLKLEFDKIHDPVRSLGNGHYFACTNFHVLGHPDKTYDLDFWIMPLNGKLVVYDENVHKTPVRKDGKWVQQPRYTFVDNQMSLLR